MTTPTIMTRDDIAAQIARFKWYHSIDCGDGVETPGNPLFSAIADFTLSQLAAFNFEGQEVIDVGARDGKISFALEKAGAARVVAVDNDPSPGMRWLIGYLGSKVELRGASLYDLDPAEQFDATICPGVIYHLDRAAAGLKRLVEITRTGGKIFIESGCLMAPQLEKLPLMFCPASENSPYKDGSSVSFYNARGLADTMSNWGCKLLQRPVCWEPHGDIRRTFFAFEKTQEKRFAYWDGMHSMHTEQRHAESDWKPDAPAGAPSP